MNKKQINTGKFLLRGIEKSDWEAILSYRSLPAIAKYQYWEPYTKKDVLVFIDKCSYSDIASRGEWIGLAIIQKDTGSLIGDCALKINKETAEIGCNISPQYQKKGFAKEILLSLIHYCFQHSDIEEVIGITDSENLSSIKLMESVSMSKSPVFEERIQCKGTLCIEHKYAIKRADWVKRSK